MRVAVVLAATTLIAALATTLNAGAGTSKAVGSTAANQAVKCGLGTGKKATGAPIKMGGIFTSIPGVDFTTIGKIAQAYFKCVNDNGGINGRPISYTLYTEQLDAAQNRNLAKKLVESDKVVGVVGNTSLIECAVNAKYYKQTGHYVIGAGVPGECFGSPNFAAVNMGPRYSNIGAAQAMIRAGAKSMIVSSPAAVAEYSNGGPALVAAAAGIPYKGFGENLPLTDPASIIQKMIQAAGPGGGVLLNYTPESLTPLLKAAVALGVVDQVIWGQSTPAANELIAKENPAFDGKLLINSEFGLLTDKGPDMTLYRAITKKYAANIPVQSFGQMGFLVGRFVTTALLNVKGEVTKKSYNNAVRGLKNLKSDILCKPWYFGNALPYHIPNNTDITVTLDKGSLRKTETCFEIQAVDPQLKQTRAWEKQFKLNTGRFLSPSIDVSP
jgi:branched-chain amino acid transport system substrate-binding protein